MQPVLNSFTSPQLNPGVSFQTINNPLTHQQTVNQYPIVAKQNPSNFLNYSFDQSSIAGGQQQQQVNSRRQELLISRRNEKLQHQQNYNNSSVSFKSIIQPYFNQFLPQVNSQLGTYNDGQQTHQRNAQKSFIEGNQNITNNNAGGSISQLADNSRSNMNQQAEQISFQKSLLQASNIGIRNQSLITYDQSKNNMNNVNKSYIQERNHGNNLIAAPAMQRNQSEEKQFEQQPQFEDYTGNSGSTLLNNKSLNQISTRRHLPINVKEKVFNEWGAVLKHQDEIDDKIRKDNFMKDKQRQMLYKNELDQQMANQKFKVTRSKVEESNLDIKLLEYQKKIELDKNYSDNQRRDNLRQLIKEKVHSSLQEKQRIQMDVKENQRFEQEKHRDSIIKIQEDEKQQQLQSKVERNMIALSYQQELQAQENVKKYKNDQVRTDDKLFAMMEQNQASKMDQNRQHYFENLKKYQERNESKQKQLSNYLSDDINTLAKKDEANYLKAVREKEEKAKRNEEDKFRNQLKTKNMNKESLAYQMQEKDYSRKLRKIEEVQYAHEVLNKVQTEQQKDMQKMEEFNQRKKEYMNSLTQQMVEGKVKRKYDHLMTEHERRVNDKDIKSYELMDNQLHSKIPGIKNNDQDLKEKYIEKMFTQNQIVGQPNTSLGNYNFIGSTSSTATNQQMLQNYNQNLGVINSGQNTINIQANLAKGNISNKSQLQLGGQSQLQNINKSIDKVTLDEVKRNMEVPEAMRYRHNTNNRAYGFDHQLNKQAFKTMPLNPEDNNQGSYSYQVNGNYKN